MKVTNLIPDSCINLEKKEANHLWICHPSGSTAFSLTERDPPSEGESRVLITMV